jgi:hypothetical protein
MVLPDAHLLISPIGAAPHLADRGAAPMDTSAKILFVTVLCTHLAPVLFLLFVVMAAALPVVLFPRA